MRQLSNRRDHDMTDESNLTRAIKEIGKQELASELKPILQEILQALNRSPISTQKKGGPAAGGAKKKAGKRRKGRKKGATAKK